MDRFLGFVSALVIVSIFSISFSRCTKSNPSKVDTVHVTVVDSVFIDNDTDVNLSRGLVVYYPFNNSLADSSGNHHNGTAIGNLNFTNDKGNNANGAVSLDGNGSYIILKDSGSLSPGAFTLAAQFYADTAVWESLCSKINFSNANSIAWGVTLYGGGGSPYPNSLGFAVRGPDVPCGQFDPVSLSDLVYSMVDIAPKRWYQVTCIFDNGVEKVYLNGVLRNAITRTFTTAKQCTDASLQIGAWYEAAPFYFHGKIDEFRFYNRALNEEEIAQLSQGF